MPADCQPEDFQLASSLRMTTGLLYLNRFTVTVTLCLNRYFDWLRLHFKKSNWTVWLRDSAERRVGSHLVGITSYFNQLSWLASSFWAEATFRLQYTLNNTMGPPVCWLLRGNVCWTAIWCLVSTFKGFAALWSAIQQPPTSLKLFSTDTSKNSLLKMEEIWIIIVYISQYWVKKNKI